LYGRRLQLVACGLWHRLPSRIVHVEGEEIALPRDNAASRRSRDHRRADRVLAWTKSKLGERNPPRVRQEARLPTYHNGKDQNGDERCSQEQHGQVVAEERISAAITDRGVKGRLPGTP
jgi:hypothetical protein